MTNPTSDPAGDGTLPPTPEGQQDYEARFKGLTREYNKLKSQHDAKEVALSQVTDQFNQHKQGSQDALIAAQNEATQAKLAAQAKENALKEVTEKYQSEATKRAELEGKAAVRKQLIDKKAVDLVPLYEAGEVSFNFDGLDDTAIETRITEFRDRLRAFALGGQTDLSGSTPPTPTPAGTAGGKAVDVDALFDWLSNPANLADKDYHAKSEQYDKLLSQPKK